MPKTHQIIISYEPGNPLAGWTFNNSSSHEMCQVQPGDLFQVVFPDPAAVCECVLLSGQTRTHTPPTPSPFKSSTPLDPRAHPHGMTVGPIFGDWGFIIAFSIQDTNGAKSFYCLPDPELQVGSTSS